MVAVFVLGKTWQFKPYKWQPPELFSHGASLPPPRLSRLLLLLLSRAHSPGYPPGLAWSPFGSLSRVPKAQSVNYVTPKSLIFVPHPHTHIYTHTHTRTHTHTHTPV